MAIRLVSRAQWGARAARSTPSWLSSTRGVKVHYTGDTMDVRLADDHGRCAARVRAIQDGHMDGNGWSDIGYSMVVCPHRYVFVGRGPNRLPAANGPGLNTGHYAVCGLVGNKGLTRPSDAMLHGIRDAIEYLRDKGGAGAEIKGHRDGYSTSCPGEPLYAWVKRGAPRPDSEEDEVPDYVSVGITAEQTLEPGKWTHVDWDEEHSDQNHQHADAGGWSLLNGPARYSLSASIKIAGLPPGTEGQIRTVETHRDSGAVAEGPIQEFTASTGDTYLLYALPADVLDSGRRLRLQVVHWGTEPARIVDGSAKVLYWR